MFDSGIIVIIVIIIVCKFTWNIAYKKALKKCDEKKFYEGYKKGRCCVEDEIRELIKLSDEEILKRIKDFAKKEAE